MTTGGTGPAPRDVTPEATEAVCERILPGYGEQMRAVSLKYVPTAVLSRQTAGEPTCMRSLGRTVGLRFVVPFSGAAARGRRCRAPAAGSARGRVPPPPKRTQPIAPPRAGTRGKALIINLPGKPKSIRETFDEVFKSIPYCIQLLEGPYIETHAAVVPAFRPPADRRAPVEQAAAAGTGQV